MPSAAITGRGMTTKTVSNELDYELLTEHNYYMYQQLISPSIRHC